MSSSKTLAEFFNSYSSNPELHRKTWKQGGESKSEVFERPNDFYDASSGSVSGFIHYTDTVKFAKKNHLEILQALEDFENQLGEKLQNKPSTEDETQYFNWLAWFAWENFMSELMSYLEN